MDDPAYYFRNAARFIEEQEPFFKAVELETARIHGDTFASKIVSSARKSFQSMLSDLPYIGGDGIPFATRNLIFGAAVLCFYQEMKSQATCLDEIGKLLFLAMKSLLPPKPEAPADAEQVKRLSGVHQNSEAFSSGHPYEFGWQTRFIDGDQRTFVWGVDYTTCGICTLFHQYHAEEFLPYLCFLDLPSYEARGVGIVRSKTLALGGDCCNFRFNLRGESRLEWYPEFYKNLNS